MPRVPPDAFDQFVAMGSSATYAAFARKMGVSKRSIVRHASAERWQERLRDIEQQARDRADRKLAEGLEAINARHLKTLRAIQHKALTGLQSLPMKSGMDCVRALTAAINAERVVLRKTEDQGSTLEDLIERSFQLSGEQPAHDESSNDDDRGADPDDVPGARRPRHHGS